MGEAVPSNNPLGIFQGPGRGGDGSGQGTLNFKLIHIPAQKLHQGPDGLSWCPPLEGEDDEADNPEDWVDEVLGLGIWVMSWMAEVVRVLVCAVEVLGVETHTTSA